MHFYLAVQIVDEWEILQKNPEMFPLEQQDFNSTTQLRFPLLILIWILLETSYPGVTSDAEQAFLECCSPNLQGLESIQTTGRFVHVNSLVCLWWP